MSLEDLPANASLEDCGLWLINHASPTPYAMKLIRDTLLLQNKSLDLKTVLALGYNTNPPRPNRSQLEHLRTLFNGKQEQLITDFANAVYNGNQQLEQYADQFSKRSSNNPLSSKPQRDLVKNAVVQFVKDNKILFSYNYVIAKLRSAAIATKGAQGMQHSARERARAARRYRAYVVAQKKRRRTTEASIAAAPARSAAAKKHKAQQTISLQTTIILPAAVNFSVKDQAAKVREQIIQRVKEKIERLFQNKSKLATVDKHNVRVTFDTSQYIEKELQDLREEQHKAFRQQNRQKEYTISARIRRKLQELKDKKMFKQIVIAVGDLKTTISINSQEFDMQLNALNKYCCELVCEYFPQYTSDKCQAHTDKAFVDSESDVDADDDGVADSDDDYEYSETDSEDESGSEDESDLEERQQLKLLQLEEEQLLKSLPNESGSLLEVLFEKAVTQEHQQEIDAAKYRQQQQVTVLQPRSKKRRTGFAQQLAGLRL